VLAAQVEIYDPASDSWSYAPRLRFWHPGYGAFAMLGQTPDGALFLDPGLDRFTAAEHFREEAG